MSVLGQDPNVYLKVGDTGTFVENVQKWLNAVGIAEQGKPLKVDGDFGPLTEHAVRAYQTQADLPATGTVDNPTYASLERGDKGLGWGIQYRPIKEMKLSYTKGPNPDDPKQTSVFLKAQILQGGEPFKTSGIFVSYTLNTVDDNVNGGSMTDDTGVATFSYAPDAFRGFVYITAAVFPQNGIDQQLLVAEPLRIDSGTYQ